MLNKRIFVCLIVLVLLCSVGFVAAATRYQKTDQCASWEDEVGLLQVRLENNQFSLGFCLDAWHELYGIREWTTVLGKPFNFRPGPFPISGLEGTVKDVCICQSEVLDKSVQPFVVTPTVFFLMEDGSVEWFWADLYQTQDYRPHYEPEYVSLGSLPFLESIQSIWMEQDYEGIGHTTVYGQDVMGLRYDLRHVLKMQYLTQGRWMCELVHNEELGDEYGCLRFFEDGRLTFKVGTYSNHGGLEKIFEQWSGFYSLVLAEEQQYPAGSLVLDLVQDWSIWEGAEEDKNNVVFRTDSGEPWYLELYLSEGSPLFSRKEDNMYYFLWFEGDSESIDGDE